MTHTQNRRLQRQHRQEQKKHEAEKLRDEHFDKYRPMIPQGKTWRVKSIDQPTGPVRPSQPTGTSNRTDCPEQPVRPVEPTTEQKAESVTPVLAPCETETLVAPPTRDDEELMDYEITKQRKIAKQKPTFDHFLNKYTCQKVVPRDRLLKKRSRSPLD